MNKLLLANAKSFKKAGLRCLEERDIDENNYEMLMFSVVVNLSFSLELFFKYVLSKQGKTIRKHELRILYDKLKNETKFQILTSYFIKTPFKNISQSETPFEKFKAWFDEKLDFHSNTFVKWRYGHETIHNEIMECDYGFLLTMIDMLEDLSNRLTNS
ncbi:hypothetical protein [Snuella sedimenti]|uniref:HEPN domain-containing protein n=1 Tax=Snuella sedimenti TaxID=2798802 RepID=A0A8J7IUB0_9FLAO|nr:hypothetical protein [Snuella sedimenti]MBJ6366760.1 hypothetical protein [Snuella sedimenti]